MNENVVFILLFLVIAAVVAILIASAGQARYHDASQNVDARTLSDYGTPEKTLYTSSKILSLHHHIDITDGNDNIVYTSRSKFLTLHNTTDIWTADEMHVANIRRKFISLHERHFITMENGSCFEMSNEIFHIIKDITNIEGLGWTLRGNILQMNFVLEDYDGSVIAQVGQKFMSIHDKYCVDIYKIEYEKEVVAILVTLIHMIRDREAASSGSSSSSSSSASSAG